jgi:hypothetical protein
MFASWFNLAMLVAESQQVVGLRMMKLALGGPKAIEEANRMMVEKMSEATHAASRLMLGASPDSIVRTYRRRVRANSRRLLRG